MLFLDCKYLVFNVLVSYFEDVNIMFRKAFFESVKDVKDKYKTLYIGKHLGRG